MAILVDSLVELGRYADVTRALRSYVDVKPGVPAYTRVSYNYELHGNLEGARLRDAPGLAIAYSPDDRAFALFQLGELAWNAGELRHARTLYRAGLGRRPRLRREPLRTRQDRRRTRRHRPARPSLPAGRRPAAPAQLRDRVRRPAHLARPHRARPRDSACSSTPRSGCSARPVSTSTSSSRCTTPRTADPREPSTRPARAWHERRSVFVEDAYAWALHVNGRDRGRAAACRARAAARNAQRAVRLPPRHDRAFARQPPGRRSAGCSGPWRSTQRSTRSSPPRPDRCWADEAAREVHRTRHRSRHDRRCVPAVAGAGCERTPARQLHDQPLQRSGLHADQRRRPCRRRHRGDPDDQREGRRRRRRRR